MTRPGSPARAAWTASSARSSGKDGPTSGVSSSRPPRRREQRRQRLGGIPRAVHRAGQHLLAVRELRRVEVEARACGRHADERRAAARPNAASAAAAVAGEPTASSAQSAPSGASEATRRGQLTGRAVMGRADGACERAARRQRVDDDDRRRAPRCARPARRTARRRPRRSRRRVARGRPRARAPTPVSAAQPSSAASAAGRSSGAEHAAGGHHDALGERADGGHAVDRSRRPARGASCRRAACRRRSPRAAGGSAVGRPAQARAALAAGRRPGDHDAVADGEAVDVRPTASTTPAPSWPSTIGPGRTHSPLTRAGRSRRYRPRDAHEHVAAARAGRGRPSARRAGRPAPRTAPRAPASFLRSYGRQTRASVRSRRTCRSRTAT